MSRPFLSLLRGRRLEPEALRGVHHTVIRQRQSLHTRRQNQQLVAILCCGKPLAQVCALHADVPTNGARACTLDQVVVTVSQAVQWAVDVGWGVQPICLTDEGLLKSMKKRQQRPTYVQKTSENLKNSYGHVTAKFLNAMTAMNGHCSVLAMPSL